jgi:ligand-binding sensor domain-containing protein
MKKTLQNKKFRYSLLSMMVIGMLFLGFSRIKINSPESNEILETIISASGDRETGLGKGITPKDELKPMKVYNHWENFTTKEGLPANKVNCVKADGNRVWAGTENGLALIEGGRVVKVYNTKDGLAHRGVLSVDVNKVTGDVWIATLSGLNVLSAGKFETYNQFNSGMPNDLVYMVSCAGKDIWVATGGGAGHLDTNTGTWEIFTEQNAPMHEPWTYAVSADNGVVYIAAWGGGIIEYNYETKRFRDYTDPDGEMEIDLYPNDGPVHDIVTAAHLSNGILWVSSYFGISRYDGTTWSGYFDHDSGLASNFVNFLKANGDVGWVCTDNGISSFNGDTWVTYRKSDSGRGGEVIITKGQSVRKINTDISICHSFTWGVDFQGEDVWVATASGLSHGKVIGNSTVEIPNL